MRRNSQNTDYRYYSYIPTPDTSSSSSRNSHYQYYDRRFRIQRRQPTLPPLPSTNISDLTEPISIFDELTPVMHHRSSITPLPSLYVSPNSSRRSSVSDARLATANVMRQRLLTDIRHTISEIDDELSSLDRRRSAARYVPSRLSPIGELNSKLSIQKKTPLPIDQNQLWPNKPKRVYKVIPRLASEAKQQSPNNIPYEVSTLSLTDDISSHSFNGQYHYGPETEEIEILENDPENIDRASIVNEIPELTSYETFSMNQFCREQSHLSQHRAMIFVPEYSGSSETGVNELSEDFHEKDPFNASNARSLTASSLHDFGSSDKLSIQDFELLVRTAPERKKPNEVELDLINQNNPMLSKPVIHSRQPENTEEKPSSTQQTVPNQTRTNDDVAHFFSDFGNEGEGEEDLISIDPSNFILPFESETIPDDSVTGQFQPSLPIPHAIPMSQQKQQQQPTIENNNEQTKETERKRIDATTKHNVIVTTSPLPSSSSPRSKQVFPISMTDNMQTQFARNNNDKIKSQTTKLNINTIDQEEDRFINLQIRLYSPSAQPTRERTDQQIENNVSDTSTNKASSDRQRSASLRRSFKTEEKNQSIKESEHVSDDKQTSPDSPTANSPIPVPLNSPDVNNDRPSSSRATTPERNNSVASNDLNVLLTTDDVIDFEDPSLMTSTNQLQPVFSPPLNTERDEPSPLQEFPSRIQHHSKSDKPELPLMSTETNVDHPSISPSNNKQEEDVQQRLLIPDLTNNHDDEENDRLKSVSPIDVETKKYEDENSTPKFEYDDLRSPSISPRHSELSDENLTSVDREDTYRQLISPDHNNNYDQITEKPASPSLEPKLTPKNERYPSAEKSTSPSPEPKLIPENERYPLARKPTSPSPEPTLIREDERYPSAKKSTSSTNSKHEDPCSPSAPPSIDEEGLPLITPSQRRSNLSLVVRQKKTKRRKSINDQPLSQTDTENSTSMNNDQKSQQQRHVLFSTDIAHFQTDDDPHLPDWRQRVDVILEKHHFHHDKYSHIKSRVNSFGNFEYRSRTFTTVPKKKSAAKQIDNDERKLKNQSVQQIVAVKGKVPPIFGRLWREPDGRPRIFSESLHWDVESKLKAYSLENLHHKPHKSDLKIFNKKPRWHSESKLAEIIKNTPRHQTVSLPAISDKDEPLSHHQKAEIERKIFDIHSTDQQLTSIFQQNFVYNVSYKTFDSKPSEKPIFDEKLLWKKKSKLKDSTWGNINYQPKKSNIQIFHKSVHWNSEPKIRSRSLSTTRVSLNHSQIFHEKLNWDTKAKIQYWSEVDLRQYTKRKALFAQYYDSKWSDIIPTDTDIKNNTYPKRFSNRTMWKEASKVKDSVEEHLNSKLDIQTVQELDDRRHLQGVEQESEEMGPDLQFSSVFLSQFRRVSSPANRPKWNSVSKTRSVNTVYNPKIQNSNLIRRGWDYELRRRRIHILPPLKRKREHDEIPRLTLEQPSSVDRLAIDYNYDHSSPPHERTASIDYATISSRRSSKVLPALKRLPKLQLSSETPRSQRPVQQEWYDEMSKSRLTHRTDMGRTGNNSFRDSIVLTQQANTPRELLTLRSSTRNSQNSVVSGTLLDSSIRTNRAAELRLSRDMDEHHHHSHTPSQSMPIEIRGFQLEGTQLTVPDNATIRPLSNVSYRASERIKRHRIYPWSNLHSYGTSSRNSPLVSIAEFRHPSFSSAKIEVPHMTHEEQE